MTKINSMYFDQDQVAGGELTEFIDLLCKQCYGDGPLYNDIRIKPEDCGAFVVEWDQVPWTHEYGGEWQWIDEDHVVMYELQLPDKSSQYVFDEEANEVLINWLKEHPKYHKNCFGIWTDSDTIE